MWARRLRALLRLCLLLCIVPAVAEAVEVSATAAVLLDADTGQVLYEKNGDEQMLIASTTKIMTALVALEQAEPDDTVTVTREHMTEGSSMYLKPGETVRVEELLYGLLLCSGNDAALALTECAGGLEPFVALMNEKAAALGLTDTHFVDASGLHDEQHYTTLRDMAIILQAAMDNEICREILSTIYYTCQPTEQHPDGLKIFNKFLSRVEYQDLKGGEIQGAKTGYTAQAMNCCASFGVSPKGRNLICVTSKAWTGDFCIDDHVALYSQYADAAN